ncbi:hypothetical protein TcYC6_0070910 [Trypanosoma cruzi]|nr:hypothetical protein TcYC6_0070910 [Trypanosoma cruzi]
MAAPEAASDSPSSLPVAGKQTNRVPGKTTRGPHPLPAGLRCVNGIQHMSSPVADRGPPVSRALQWRSGEHNFTGIQSLPDGKCSGSFLQRIEWNCIGHEPSLLYAKIGLGAQFIYRVITKVIVDCEKPRCAAS